MVASAAQPGSTTKDGNGANSPYTAALLKHLAQSDLEIARALARVHDDVVASTKSKQEPVVYGVQGALREYYGRKEGPPIASTLDHIVAAVAG